MRNAPAERSGESGSATRGITAGSGTGYFLLIQWLRRTKLAFGAVALAAARAELLHEKDSRMFVSGRKIRVLRFTQSK